MRSVLVAIVVGLVGWTIWSLYADQVEQARYQVLENRGTYEIRRYAPRIEAQTNFESDYNAAINSGIVMLESYLTGANNHDQRIAVNTAVTESRTNGLKITRVAPTLEAIQDRTHYVSVVMPREHTLETLPTPNDTRVALVEVPERIIAVYPFKWYYPRDRIEEQKEYFVTLLRTEGVRVTGVPYFARYNSRGTLPFLFHNEILVEIERP